jgi:hypothetical protein
MKTLRILALALLLPLVACQQQARDLPLNADEFDFFGQEMVLASFVPVSQVATAPESFSEQWVKVEGTINQVCTNAGCWFTLDTDDLGTVRVNVQKDEDGQYLFTVPADIVGRHAIVEAWVEVVETTADYQQHLAEDAGATQEELEAAEFKPEREIRLTARSVYIKKAETTAPEEVEAE